MKTIISFNLEVKRVKDEEAARLVESCKWQYCPKSELKKQEKD
jgi:hypothetical protein